MFSGFPTSLLALPASLGVNLVPANLQKRLARFLLKRALGNLVVLSNSHFDLDTQIDVSLQSLTLRDLQLNLDTLNAALRAARIPLCATHGVLGSVAVSVPWLDLAGSSCSVELDGVRIALSPLDHHRDSAHGDEDDTPTPASSSSSASSDTSSPSASATLDTNNPMMMASSIYMANEFLRHGGMSPTLHEPAEPPLAQQLADSISAASVDGSTLDGGGGLEGVQLLAGLIDTIIANLVISISNVSVSLNHHPGGTPSLQCEIPCITVDRAESSFFEAAKRVTIPQFRVRTTRQHGNGEDNDTPILWAPEPMVVELVIPSTGTRPPPPPSSSSETSPPTSRSQFVARIDIPDLTAHVTPLDLATLLSWMTILEPPLPPAAAAARSSPGRHVSWTSGPPASISPTAPSHDDDQSESDFEQTDDDFLSAAGTTATSAVGGGTVFYSAMHASVVAPSTRRDGLELNVHHVSVTVVHESLTLVVSLGALHLETSTGVGVSASLGPVGVVANGHTVVHVPDGIAWRAGTAQVTRVQMEVHKHLVDALTSLMAAVGPMPTGRTRRSPRQVQAPLGFTAEVADIEARVHGFLPAEHLRPVIAVNVSKLRWTAAAQRQVTVGSWQVTLLDKVSKLGSRDVSTVAVDDLGHVRVTCARVDAELTREDYLLLLPPPSPPTNPSVSDTASVVDLALASLILTLPDVATRPEIHLLGVDFALRPGAQYRFAVRRVHLVSQGTRLIESVARPSSAGSNGPHPRRRPVAIDVQGQGSIHDVKLGGLCVTLTGKDQVQVLQDVGELFNVPPPPPDLPPPAPLTTSLAIRDSTLRLSPQACDPLVADVDLECIDVVMRTGPGNVLVTGTAHALALTLAGYPVATIEGCKLSAHGEPTSPAEVAMRFRVTLSGPSAKVHVTPESLAASVLVLRNVQEAFADPPPLPARPHSQMPATSPLPSPPERNLMATVDPMAFANTNPKPPVYDVDRLTLSIVEDFSAFESELESQLVMVDPSDAAGSSGSDSGASSRASSVAGLDLVDDHFAEAEAPADSDDGMWSPMVPPTRDGPVEWTWHVVVDGLSASVEWSTAAAPGDAAAGFEHVPEMPIVALDVFDVHIEHSRWAPGHPGGVLDTLTVTLGTLEVRDLVPMSPWNKMVTAARTANVTPTVGGPAARVARAAPAGYPAGRTADAGTRLPGGTALPFARMDATCVLGPEGPEAAGQVSGGGEWRAKVRVVPIKLHVFQETVDAVVQFVSSVMSKIADDDEELVLIDSPATTTSGATSTAPPVMSSPPRPPPFFQRVEVHPISLRIDYKPKSVDLPALQRGKVLELLNVFHLEGAEMTLRHVTVTGARGWDGLVDALVSYWVPHVRNTQLPGMVSGVGPLRSLVNIGTGVADLFLLPVEQYRRDGRLVKGLKKGAHSFVRTAAVETLSLGAKLAVGTHTILERADTIVSHPADPSSSSSHATSPVAVPGRSPDLARRRSTSASSYTTPASPSSPSHRVLGARASPSSSPRTVAVSKYANQPSNTREGLEQAMRTLSENVTQAARVIAIPVEVMERDGATGTVRAVLRAVPIAILKPMLGATDAVGKTLMGMRNALDPDRRREVLDKYKATG